MENCETITLGNLTVSLDLLAHVFGRVGQSDVRLYEPDGTLRPTQPKLATEAELFDLFRQVLPENQPASASV